ncbi:hypothetical protein CK203_104928 [Vitis vinifera]|uniref:Uncharacterized protein n=1 Tax=Vitis vinifera TaxID=29760 RepID=A0A438CQZ7_VITVI|nr:hypothetical protein CK203_104928 [Vitis vinifera]
MAVSSINKEEKMEAFQLLHQTTPYIAFALPSMAFPDKDSSSRTRRAPKARITGLVKDGDSLSGLKASLKELAEYAATMGVPLQLNTHNAPSQVCEREQRLPQGGPPSDKEARADTGDGGGAGRQPQRALLPGEIPGVITLLFSHIRLPGGQSSKEQPTEDEDREGPVEKATGRAGFQVVGMKSMSQARMMLSVYGCDGYSLACEKGCLLLGWKGKPIMLASAWQVAKASSS